MCACVLPAYVHQTEQQVESVGWDYVGAWSVSKVKITILKLRLDRLCREYFCTLPLNFLFLLSGIAATSNVWSNGSVVGLSAVSLYAGGGAGAGDCIRPCWASLTGLPEQGIQPPSEQLQIHHPNSGWKGGVGTIRGTEVTRVRV